MIVGHGKTVQILNTAPTSAGSTSVDLVLESDAVFLSLYAASVSGSLDVSAVTLTEAGREVSIITFPQLTVPTTDLLLRKGAATLSRVRVTATYSDACDFEIYARGIGSGETSVKILGASTARVLQKTITTGAAQLLITSALTDRAGFQGKNTHTTATLYIGFTAAEATASSGFPVGPGDTWQGDLGADQAIWAVGTSTIDARIIEAGT